MSDRMSELVVEIADAREALKEYSKAERARIKDLQTELENIAKGETEDGEDD